MIRGLIRLFWQLLTLLVVIAALLAVWIIYDGINDVGDTADCAVVLGTAVKANGMPAPVLQERLDRAVQLYQAGKVPVIIVSGADHVGGNNEATAMASYLETEGVPTKAVIQDHQGINTDATAHDTAQIMREHNLHSVMVVTSYYHITRTKMALRWEGVKSISQAHAGVVRKEDAFNIAREVADIYYHVFKNYIVPATMEAATAAKNEAGNLKGQISSGLNGIEDQGKMKPVKQ
jgi:vancomycin permeability regulator SanA